MNPLHKQNHVSRISSKAELEISFMKSRLESESGEVVRKLILLPALEPAAMPIY